MKVQKHTHLQEEQIIWAVIDEQELGGDDLQHLLACPDCKKKVAQFRSELQEFGQKAGGAVPPFSRPVRLPTENPAAVLHGNGWLPFFGAVAMASFVVFFYFMGLQNMASSQLITLQGQESLLEDESLMREIADMVDYPLSEDMYEISGDNGIDLDDDFLQFVVPDIQDDFQT
jgi:hypothetical protein